MDYSIIDTLYEIYMNEDLGYAEVIFTDYLKKSQKDANNIKAILQQYIQEQTKNISNYYASNKDENNKVKNIVKETTLAFETFIEPVSSFILYNFYDYYDLEEMKYNHTLQHKVLTANDLFSINMDLMEEAVKENASFYLDEFKNVKAIIEYVKKNKLLEKLYSDGSWKAMNFSDLIESLYDKAKDKSVFEVSHDGIYDYEDTLFNKVKENCSKISTIEFDKYRSKLISSKQITLEYGKLIFCKNLLMFYNSGIMPTNDGLLDCSVDFYELLNLVDDFKKLYSKKFDEKIFRESQSNFICKPEIITTNYELKTSKKVSFDNRIIIGHLLIGNCSFMSSSNYEIPYLIHINIKDVNNPCSDYEIQLNLIPQGDISNRLQLMRLDNWDTKQPHRNLANKLTTTTHIHLYNQFDLIRGKDNGEFEIVYNFEDKSTEFKTAFLTFLNILDFDADLKKELYYKTMREINRLRSVSKSTDV